MHNAELTGISRYVTGPGPLKDLTCRTEASRPILLVERCMRGIFGAHADKAELPKIGGYIRRRYIREDKRCPWT